MDVDLIIDLLDLVFELILYASNNDKPRKQREKASRFEATYSPQDHKPTKGYDQAILHPELYIAPKREKPAQVMVNYPNAEQEKSPVAQATSYDKVMRSIELEIYMLTYLLQQDDGMITNDEARILRRHIRPHNLKLKDEDIKRIKTFASSHLTIEEIIDKIRASETSEHEVKTIVKRLNKVAKVTKRHKRIVDFITTQIYSELGYL